MSSVATDLDLEDEDATPAKDADGVPYCRKHHCRMVQSSGGKADNPKSYYKCKVKDCKETARIVKTPNPKVVPDQPVECSRCSKAGKPVVCERDEKSSNASMVILKCPRCQWKSSAFVVPHLAAAYLAYRQRPAVEDIGER